MRQQYASTWLNKTGFAARSSHGLTWHDVHRGVIYVLSWVLQKVYFSQSLEAPQNIKEILVLQPGKIGDLIMTLPFIRTLKNIFPQSPLTLVVHPACHALAALEADSVIDYCSPLYHRCQPGQPQGLGKIIPGTDHCFDLLVDLKSDFASLWYSFRHARYRLDLASLGLAKYFNKFLSRLHRQSFQNPAPCHHTELMRQALEAFTGQKAPLAPYRLMVPGSQETAARLRRQFEIADRERLVILHPGGSRPWKLWPLEKYAALADRLSKELGVTLMVTGGSTETEIAKKLGDLMHFPLKNITGRLDLIELAAFLPQAALVIANDSSVAHLAAAVGTPVIVLFGPTDPTFCAPRGPEVEVVKGEIDCSPCPQRACRQPAGSTCMDLIEVEQVYNLAKDKLAIAA